MSVAGASSIADRYVETQAKLTTLRERMVARGIGAAHLTTIASTAWITAGASTYVNEATEDAASSILVTLDHAYVLTNSVEEPRLRQEEQLEALGFEFVIEPWYASGRRITALAGSGRIGRETPLASEDQGLDLSADMSQLRMRLLASEVARLRRVCALATEAMDETARAIRPGWTEHAVAARLAAASRIRGGSAVVNLVASDQRIALFRHPLPTARVVERYVMAVLCFRCEGLIASVTRLVHFGALPDELRAKSLALAQVDAHIIAGTQPGRTLGDMFALARAAYADVGYPSAIEEHHQGGVAGYLTREEIATPTSATLVAVNQAFAWNPSIRGVKSEDTMLLTDQGPEILTAIAGWPTTTINVDAYALARPLILEVS